LDAGRLLGVLADMVGPGAAVPPAQLTCVLRIRVPALNGSHAAMVGIDALKASSLRLDGAVAVVTLDGAGIVEVAQVVGLVGAAADLQHPLAHLPDRALLDVLGEAD